MRSRASGGICGDSSAAPERRDHVELAAAGDLRHAREVDRAQLDRRAGERAHDGAGVAGVDQQPQPRQQVAHLGALEERRGARQPVRHGALLERDRDRLALAAHRPHEHAHVLGRDVLARDQPLDLGRHRLRLRALGRAAPERDLAAGLAVQLLLDPVGRRRDDRAGGAQDLLARAQRLLEPHHRRRRPLGAEVVHVLRRGAAEAVDRLVVVGGGGDVAVPGHEQPQQQALREARVLQLVDQHVPVPAREPLAHVRLRAQQPEGAAGRGRRRRACRPRRASARGRRRARRTRARARAPPAAPPPRRRSRRRTRARP